MPQHTSTPSSDSEIRLRAIATNDLPLLFAHQCEPEAADMAAFSTRARDDFMAHWEKLLSDQNVHARAILLNNCLTGNIVSWTQDGNRLVGYWIGKQFWHQGVATRALRRFLRLIPERPLRAYVANHNRASIRVLEKCGFRRCTTAKHKPVEPDRRLPELLYRLDQTE